MDYYQTARKASAQIGSHAGLLYLQRLCRTAGKVLDVGCGEGTRLNILLPAGKRGCGIDPSPRAIRLAQKRYPGHRFRVGVGESLPFRSAAFDLVYSAFAIEHCADPQKFLTEMIRVCRPGGWLVVLAPNYGAPNRRSPNSLENPYNKFFEGLIKDFFPHPALDWRQVTPQPRYRQVDADTTWEPYLYSLYLFLKTRGLTVDRYSSLWELEPKSQNMRKTLISVLGNLSVFPVSNWGPQLFVAAVK